MRWLKKISETFFIFLIQRRIFLPVLFVVMLPIVVRFALISWQGTENRVEEWISDSFEETRLLIDFMTIFGSDEILMISWEGCDLDSPQLQEFQRKLTAPVLVAGEERVLYQAVFTGAALFDQLAEMGIPDDEIFQKLEGWIISPHDNTTCVLAKISYDGTVYRREAVELIEKVANEIDGLDFKTLHVAGSTTESIAIDKACSEYLVQTNVASYLLCILLSWLCSRNIRTTLLIIGLSLFCQQVCLAIIYLSGVSFGSVLMLTVNLTFVLSVSIGVHFVNYYRAAMASFPARMAPFMAIRRGWTPTFLSIFTTVIGLASLSSSRIIPIYHFGILGAAAILASMVIMLVYLGVSFVIMPVRAWDREYSPKDTGNYPKRQSSKNKRRSPKNKRRSSKSKRQLPPVPTPPKNTAPLIIIWLTEKFLPRFTTKYCRHILIVSVLLAMGCGMGFMYSHTAVGLKNMLLPGTKPIQDYKWMESTIGPLVPVEVLFKIPVDDDNPLINDLYVLDEIQNQLQEQIQDTVVISLLNFLPALPQKQTVLPKTVYNRKVVNNLDRLKETSYIQTDDRYYYLRITARTYALGDVDYGDFTREVKSIVGQQLARLERQDDISFSVSGGVPLVYRVQTQLLLDVKQSFLLAFVLIASVLCVQLRSVPAGLLCFFPNVLPCIVVFGIIGWSGVPLEIGTILTISTTLGIAVDNSIHFINWYRIAIRKNMGQQEAVYYAFSQCGPALLQTTAIFSLGMLVFAWTVFIPTITFAVTISLLLTLALVCDLTILPAILISPMGRLFLSHKKKHR